MAKEGRVKEVTAGTEMKVCESAAQINPLRPANQLKFENERFQICVATGLSKRSIR